MIGIIQTIYDNNGLQLLVTNNLIKPQQLYYQLLPNGYFTHKFSMARKQIMIKVFGTRTHTNNPSHITNKKQERQATKENMRQYGTKRF